MFLILIQKQPPLLEKPTSTPGIEIPSIKSGRLKYFIRTKMNRNKENHVVPDVQLNLLRDEKLQPKRRQHGANVLVLDSSYSWIICFANFVLMATDSAFVRAINMTFLNIVEDFQVTITEASVGFTLELVFFSLSSMLVTSLVVPKTGERIPCIIGAALGSLCTIGISLSPNIACFLILMAFKGISAGTMVMASIALISQYFEKRKSFATAVACSGLALGSMGAPPVIKLFIEVYGTQGAFFLFGALEMNNICMAMLLRPTTRYTRVISSGQDECIQTTNEINIPCPPCKQDKYDSAYTADVICSNKQVTCSNKDEENIELLDRNYHLSQQSQILDMEMMSIVKNSNDSEDVHNVSIKLNSGEDDHNLHLQLRSDEDVHNLSTKQKSAQEFKTHGEYGFNSSSLGKVATEIQHQQKDYCEKNINKCFPLKNVKINDITKSISSSSLGISGDNISSVFERTISYDNSNLQTDELNSNDSRIDQPNVHDNKSSHVDKKHQQMGSKLSKLNVSSTWSVISAPVSDVFVGLDFCALQESSATCDEDQIYTLNKGCFSRFLKWLHGAFNIHLFRTWSLRALLLYNMTGVLVGYLSTYFPTIGTKSGLNNDEIALMLIISGGVDFASRLAIGAFTDFNLLTTTQIVAIAQIIIGTASHFTHFYTSFEALMVLAVIIGVFGGVRQTFGTLICLQFMGAEKYVQALGFQTMTATLTMAVHHPLLSSILEVSGSFNPPLHYVGVAAYLSAIILLLEPYIKRMDAARQTSTETKQVN
ncbi:hypothetical protein Btru_048400 [Bulinus truncatus]|nr:hypothetical protein Btru_048400 [Bulinus truncatus]